MTLQYGYSEQQTMIADSAEKLCVDLFSSAARRTFIADQKFPAGWCEALGDSGLLGICAPERIGGAALGALDALSILIATGRHAGPWPVAESIVGAALLAESHSELAGEIMAGRRIPAFAPSEALAAQRSGDGWRVSGGFDAAPWAPLADVLVIETAIDDAVCHFVLELDRPGFELQTRKSIDPLCPIGHITLDAVAVDEADRVGPVDPRWRTLRTLFACAEMVGAAGACLDMAVDYMKVRKQFGQLIGRFQALKHVAANDALYLESMRLAIEYAAWGYDTGAEDTGMALHIAKQYCADHARTVAEDAIQLHGGIGFTWDYDLHLYLRRILRLGASLGLASEHREAIAQTLIETFSES